MLKSGIQSIIKEYKAVKDSLGILLYIMLACINYAVYTNCF